MESMELLTRLERTLESALEGFFGQTFRGRIQPAEIARRLQREMEANKVISPGSVFAPNRFVAQLHPDDLAHLAPALAVIAPELERFLRDYAEERGYCLAGAVAVLVESHENVRAGTLRVAAELAKGEAEISDRPAAGTVERTLTVQLGAGAGATFPLTTAEITLGRDADNTIALDDRSISRRHARIALEGEDCVLYDANSTNGTFVNGRQITRHVLRAGDQIRLGNTLLGYRVVRVV